MPDQLPGGGPTIWLGEPICQTGTQAVFDPALGWTYEAQWVGTREEIDLKAAEYGAQVRIARTVQDDQHYLTATTLGSPVDVYEFSTEYESVDVWANPIIQEATYLEPSSNDHIDCIGKFRRFCETRLRDLYSGYPTIAEEESGTTDKIAAGKGPTPPGKLGLFTGDEDPLLGPGVAEDFTYPESDPDNPVGNATEKRVVRLNSIYWMFLMGAERWESRRIVLSRRRTTPPTAALQHEVDAVELVYTTKALVAEFTIPKEVADRLPPDPPTAPRNTAWSWKVRRQDSVQMVRTGRIEEVLDFVFAAWTLEMFELVPDPVTPPP